MSLNTQWDSIQIQPLDLPYDRIQAELNTEPRIYRGQNSLITRGGKLTKRPGTLSIHGIEGNIAKRCDRLWIYETIDFPPKTYFVGSFFNNSNSKWELYYIKQGTSTWIAVPTLRDSNLSIQPHELVVSRGLAYIKSFPDSGSTEKLGTIIFDGSGSGTPSTKPWGILGPTEPTAIVGATTRLSAPISTTTATSITVVSSSGFPATPFTAQIDFEQVSVTNISGTTWTITRAINETTATTHDTNAVVIWRDWSVSDHKVTVNWYWRYTYCYKTITGQISNRAPVQTNIDKLPSATGPFFDLIPKITYQGTSDTTNIPTIVIERTTDGGGTYWKLKELNNPGTGPQTFSDTYLETGTAGGNFKDPIPDDVIDTAVQSPSLTSNSPPPTVLDPLIIGVDTPQVTSGGISSYSGRLFMPIGNVLFFSGDEEIQDGIPEECWPSGSKGNFFRFQYPVTNLQSTADSLYIFTTQSTYQLTGTNLETFSIRPIFESMGHPYSHPRAITRWNDVVAYLTQDYRVAIINNSQATIVSDPLGNDLVSGYFSGMEFDFKYWGELDKEFLIVSGHKVTDTTKSRQWVFDIKKSERTSNLQPFKPFWNAPWTIRSTASASGRINGSSSRRYMVWAIWDGNNTNLVYFDSLNSLSSTYISSDYSVTSNSQVGFDFSVETNQFQVPTGDHVNSLRAPSITPVVYGILYDRNLFSGDTDPANYAYLDDFWTDPIPLEIKAPWRRPLSKSYKTIYCPVDKVAQHFAIKIEKINSKDLFEMQNLTIIYIPDSGS